MATLSLTPACARGPPRQAIEDGKIDVGEMVAQHMYLYLYDLGLQEQSEWFDSDDVVEGTVVFDSDPD